MAARRRVERRDKRFPILLIEREDLPVGETLYGLLDHRIGDEFADGVMCRRLRGPFCGPAQLLIGSFGPLPPPTSGAASSHLFSSR